MTARSPLVFSPGAAGPVLRLVPAADPHALTWRDLASCAEADPDAFFPETGGSTRDARRVCAACPVAAQCLAYALEHEEPFGIWGGMTTSQRRRLLRRGREAA